MKIFLLRCTDEPNAAIVQRLDLHRQEHRQGAEEVVGPRQIDAAGHLPGGQRGIAERHRRRAVLRQLIEQLCQWPLLEDQPPGAPAGHFTVGDPRAQQGAPAPVVDRTIPCQQLDQRGIRAWLRSPDEPDIFSHGKGEMSC